jgi:polyhydroxyalkanoate synthesis regulator phasin
MFENLKKAFDKGVEFAFATEAKIEKAAKDFARENNLTTEEAKKLLDHWLKKSEEARNSMEKQITELQKKLLAKMNLVTREEMKKLEDRIRKLEGYHKKPVAPGKTKIPVKKAVKKPR